MNKKELFKRLKNDYKRKSENFLRRAKNDDEKLSHEYLEGAAEGYRKAAKDLNDILEDWDDIKNFQ